MRKKGCLTLTTFIILIVSGVTFCSFHNYLILDDNVRPQLASIVGDSNIALIAIFYFFLLISMMIKEENSEKENSEITKLPANDDPSLKDEVIRLKKVQKVIHEKWKQEREQRVKLHNAYKDLYKRHKEQATLQGNFIKEKETHEDLQKAYIELKQTQDKLLQAEKMSSLGKLTAGIAHEINNPVNFVANGVRALRENITQLISFIDNYKKISQLDSIEEIKKYSAILVEDEEDLNDLKESTTELLDDADYGTERITEIVKGLRSFSRQDESECTEVNINDILEGALAILKPKYKKNAVIEKNLDQNLLPIRCFHGQINQVLVNLIGNASDAIEGQGVISITTREFDADNIEISIKDNGKGMTDEVKNKIFDPFFTTKEIGKGTGLGLSITYGIIKNHQGSIKVESTPGVGTEFILHLPKDLQLTPGQGKLNQNI